MNDPAPPDAPSLPAATPVRRRRVSLGWVLPIVGLGLLVYFAYWAYQQKQANVTLEVQDASGIKAFQTPVLCRGVEVGSVTGVELHPGGRGATVRMRLEPSGLRLATADSDWWIVRPRLGLTNVSDVESLLAGPSIEFRPGVESPAREFEGLAGPPADAGMTGGLRLILRANDRGAVDPGTPLRYRGVEVGRVVSLRLPQDGTAVLIIVEVDRPYAHLIRENTAFWHSQRARADISRVSLGLEGYAIEFPRLNTALDISIDLASPDEPGSTAAADTVFDLADMPPEDADDWQPDLKPRPRPEAQATDDDTDAPDGDASTPEEQRGPLEGLFDLIIPFN
ncbi:MAG: MlaD family protein [Planctomycetota bacterium]